MVQPTHLVGTSQVDSDHLVPHLLIHVDECLVPENTSIGNKDVYGAEGIDGGFDDSVALLSGADGRDGVPTSYQDGELYYAYLETMTFTNQL